MEASIYIKRMYLNMMFVLLISFFSCQKEEISKEKLIGKWETIDEKQSPIILEINKKNISRFENGKNIIYDRYILSKDTLILINTKFKEKHLIQILTDRRLLFKSINSYEKDIELIDAVEFIKM